MRSNQEPEKRGALDELLSEWQVDSPLPPRFQESVWERIRRAEEEVEPGVWTKMLATLNAALPRPKIAVSYVAALLLVGVATGSMTAQFQARHLKEELSSRYVHALDPYLETGSQP